MIFIEKALLPLSRSHPAAHEFLWFGLKQAWACIFGTLLLAGILATRLWYPEVPLARYDFLVVYAVSIQVSLLFLKLESWREVGVIFLFHLMATAMELFKTSTEIGSWSYPENLDLRMPLLLGFCLVAFFIYLAENLGTLARAWQYPGQENGWKPVHFFKFTAWYTAAHHVL